MKHEWGKKLVLILVTATLGVSFFIIIKNTKTYNTIFSSTEIFLKKMEYQSIDEINEEIKEVRNKETSNDGTGGIKDASLAKQFSNTIIIGDSIAEGLVEYQVLPSANVIAVRGASVDKIKDAIKKAISYKPETVFLEFGMNDLERYKGNSDAFITEYKKRIVELQSGLPKVEIFVNNILPIKQVAIDKTPENAYYNRFNYAISKMCKEMGLVYLTNDALLYDIANAYESDGIHPTYAFYPLWAKNMAEAADL